MTTDAGAVLTPETLTPVPGKPGMFMYAGPRYSPERVQAIVRWLRSMPWWPEVWAALGMSTAGAASSPQSEA